MEGCTLTSQNAIQVDPSLPGAGAVGIPGKKHALEMLAGEISYALVISDLGARRAG